ncbi:hypothetical protein RhiJN_05967 [Ceratobasidium sp. AG-Ba]|nr:hypothetical protein RhiJN_05967 [Ceratobasidium sp. AG-Ba]
MPPVVVYPPTLLPTITIPPLQLMFSGAAPLRAQPICMRSKALTNPWSGYGRNVCEAGLAGENGIDVGEGGLLLRNPSVLRTLQLTNGYEVHRHVRQGAKMGNIVQGAHELEGSQVSPIDSEIVLLEYLDTIHAGVIEVDLIEQATELPR